MFLWLWRFKCSSMISTWNDIVVSQDSAFIKKGNVFLVLYNCTFRWNICVPYLFRYIIADLFLLPFFCSKPIWKNINQTSPNTSCTVCLSKSFSFIAFVMALHHMPLYSSNHYFTVWLFILLSIFVEDEAASSLWHLKCNFNNTHHNCIAHICSNA